MAPVTNMRYGKGDLVAGGEQDVFLAGSSTPASVFLPGATLIHIIFMDHTITNVQIVKYCTQCALKIIQSMSRMKLSYYLPTICSLILWGMDVHGQRQRVAHSFLLGSIGIKYRRNIRIGVVFYLSRIFFCERVYWVANDSVPSDPFTTEVLAATKNHST